jgi:class 3 adenylate cyclase
VAEVRDWGPFVEAGLLPSTGAEHADRRALLEYLLDEGCTLEEMVEADRRGRLFGLAGDRIVRPGARELTFPEVAERLGADEAMLRRVWRALGLVGWDSDAGVASADDVEALGFMTAVVALAGDELALQLARSVAAALSRSAEAANAIARTVSPEGALETSGSELETARWWGGLAPVVVAMGRLLDELKRHHMELAREHFDRSGSADIMHRSMTRVAVGFVDMSGFTTATEQLGEDEFARLLASFSVQVDETVRDLGGRVVKFVGDAAMVVAPDASILATIADALVEGWAALGSGLTLHAGLAHGEVLCQDGDYFGSPVNLAARLAARAGPGVILATAGVGAALPEAEWAVEWLDPQPIRGMADPVATCLVRRVS